MTYDTDEHNSVPYKISISSENVTDDHVRQHFEKGLSALLADPYFLLLYVPENGAKMQIIQPAKDSYHQKRIEQRINEAKDIPSFYYALSHLWKITENNRHLWEEIGEYVNDLGGKPAAPVSMRREKRDTLLRLLKDHPDSYWWIDVLCARSDTPLDIMGDIYSCCLECIAMIDCETNLISRLHTEKNMRKELYDEDYINASKSSNSSSDYLLHCKQIYEKYSELVEDLCAFQQSGWWNRVWTLQEMALPFGAVLLMAETDIDRLQSNTITMDDLLNSFKNAMDIILYMKHKNEYDPVIHKFLFYWFVGIFYSRAFKKRGFEITPAYEFFSLFSSLASSFRLCMDPVDYVYGVLGMLQIKIPRMTDPKKVWQRFLSELDDYMQMAGFKNQDFQDPEGIKVKIIGIREDAHEINLTTVEHMGDVYDCILELEDEE
ncbi:hypothetical protein K492DRAFT_193038 [Lichtheimia hyalospora FSU 10163]|nr:hypothetical protein K492DRAFT_193038 [Lichtheimia hyalospora FSU 10163]